MFSLLADDHGPRAPLRHVAPVDSRPPPQDQARTKTFLSISHFRKSNSVFLRAFLDRRESDNNSFPGCEADGGGGAATAAVAKLAGKAVLSKLAATRA